MEASEPEGVQPDGHTLPPEVNYRATDVIDHWVGQLGRAYIEGGIAAKLYEAGYTSIQDMAPNPPIYLTFFGTSSKAKKSSKWT